MVARRTLKRIRRILAGAFYCALIGGVGHLAVTRWNGTPAAPRGGVGRSPLPPQPIDPALDRTDEYIAALAAIPPKPIVTLPPPPAGMKWNPPNWGGNPIDENDTRYGPWTPRTRPNLQAVIDYFDSPATKDAMRKLAAIRPGICRVAEVQRSSILQAAYLFAARARYRHAAHGDIDGAIADLGTVLRLASVGYDSLDESHSLSIMSCEEAVDWELRCLAHERRLTHEQLEFACSTLRAESATQRELWELTASAVFDHQKRCMDLAYTNDGNDDGWLVLSHLNASLWLNTTDTPRCGLWNALSVFYNDRRTVVNKIECMKEAFIRAEQADSLEQADAAIEDCIDAAKSFNLLDGPVAIFGRSDTLLRAVFDTNLQHRACRSASIAAMALSVYRSDHGEYPVALDALLDGYLEALPLNPYAGALPGYVRIDDGSDYLLYMARSGYSYRERKRTTEAGRDTPTDVQDDLVIPHTRIDAHSEPTLEPAIP